MRPISKITVCFGLPCNSMKLSRIDYFIITTKVNTEKLKAISRKFILSKGVNIKISLGSSDRNMIQLYVYHRIQSENFLKSTPLA